MAIQQPQPFSGPRRWSAGREEGLKGAAPGLPILDSSPDQLFLFCWQAVDRAEPRAENVFVDDTCGHQRLAELSVLLSIGYSLRNPKVVCLEAPSSHAVGSGSFESDQTISPTVRQDGGRFADASGVVAKCGVEHRSFADRSVDQVCLRFVRIIESHYVDFDRSLSSIGQLAFNGSVESLATDDHHLIGSQNAAGGSNGVLKLGAFQGIAPSGPAKCL